MGNTLLNEARQLMTDANQYRHYARGESGPVTWGDIDDVVALISRAAGLIADAEKSAPAQGGGA